MYTRSIFLNCALVVNYRRYKEFCVLDSRLRQFCSELSVVVLSHVTSLSPSLYLREHAMPVACKESVQ